MVSGNYASSQKRTPSTPTAGAARGAVVGTVASAVGLFVGTQVGSDSLNEAAMLATTAAVASVLTGLGKFGREKGGWRNVLFGWLF